MLRQKLLLGLYFCFELSSANIEIKYFPSVLSSFRRTKRQLNNNTCIENCMLNMQNDIFENMKNYKILDHTIVVDLTPEDVPIFCPRVFNLMNNCVNKCPDDEAKYYVTSGFMPMHYICVDNFEGAAHGFPCAYKVMNTTQKSCVEPCETETKTEARGNINDEDHVSIVWTAKCKQTTCVFNCQSVEVRLQCDEESMTFMKGLTKSGLEASEKMLIHSVGEQFPLECKKLLANLS